MIPGRNQAITKDNISKPHDLESLFSNSSMTQGNSNGIAFDKYENDSNDTFLLSKPKILNPLNLYLTGKKQVDLETIFDHLRRKPPIPIKNW